MTKSIVDNPGKSNNSITEQTYQELVKGMPFAVYTCDMNGYLTLFNEAAENICGIKPALDTVSWCDSLKIFRLDGTPIPSEECPLIIISESGELTEYDEEFIIEWDNQSRHYLRRYPSLLKDANGKVTGAVNILHDITTIKETENKLRQSELKFRHLIEKATVATAVLHGPDMILTLANDVMLNIWDRDKSVIGMKLLEFMPELRSQAFPQLLRNVYTTGEPYLDEDALVIIKRKGELQNVYMDFSYTALSVEGTITDILISAVDVSEKVMYQRQLEESEKNLRNIIEQAPVGMCLLRGPQFVVEIANDRILEIWGKSAETVLHKALIEGLPEIKNQGIESLLSNVYNTGERFEASDFEVTVIRGGHSETIFVNFVYEALRENSGVITGIVAVVIETTDQIKARRAGELLQQQKDDFIGITSHELKTPVTVIKVYTQILQQLLSGKELKQEELMVQKMNQQIDRLNSLIVDLLDTTKVNSGKLQLNDADVEFNEMVTIALDEIDVTTQSHVIEREFGPDTIVHCDKERICQVIDNLVSNAIKYSPAQKKIIVKTEIKNDHVHLGVQDFGIGIRDADRQKIFEQFYRVTVNGIPNTYPGLGLGLFISAEIIRREHGEIWVKSEEGKGSVFGFSLPCKTKTDH